MTNFHANRKHSYCKRALAVAWVVSLSVGLGSTLGLIALTSRINVNKLWFEEMPLMLEIFELDKSMVRLEDKRW